MKKGFEKYTDKTKILFETVGKLTMTQRLIISVAAFSLLIAAFYFLSFMPKFEEIARVEEVIQRTEVELASAKKKADLLDKLKKEWEDKEAKFEVVMEALPDKKEIPSLLGEISAAGRNSGLDFQSFAPRAEISKGFYAEIPVSIRVSGSYDRLQMFFTKVSEMARVVNIKNISITTGQGGETLSTSCTAVTYRFLPEKK